MKVLPILLCAVELYTLFKLGSELGAFAAIFYVFATLMLGLLILRRQGMQMIERLQGVQQGRMLGSELLVDDMAMGLAGVLLMFPGIISDFAAVVVMIGPLRRRLARMLGGQQAEHYAPQRDFESDVTIEGQYTRVDEKDVN